MKKKAFILTVLLISIFISLNAQELPFNPDEAPIQENICKRAFHQHDFEKSVVNPNVRLFDYDVKFYHINLETTDTSNQFTANTIVTGKVVVTQMDTFLIELSYKLQPDSAFINGVKYPFTHASNDIYILLPSPIFKNELFDFHLYYHTPEVYSTNYFSSTVDATYGNFHVTQSMAEPYNAHDWFPCKQELEDKADSVFVFVTVDSSLRAAGPGTLTEVPLPSNKTRYEWRTHQPTAYYLIFLAVSDYQEYTIYAHPDSLPSDSIPIVNYVYDYPGCLETNKANIDRTPSFVELFSNEFGLFPFYEEKYGHYMWRPSGFSGMEHMTMSGMRYFSFDLISHELGHSWFGDNVTCATWSDIWVNEGFASYAQYLARQYIISQSNADNLMRNWYDYVMGVPDGSVYVPASSVNSIGRIFNTRLTYRKGAALVHMIRFEMDNDSLFFRSLYEYQQTYKDSVATGIDFRNVCQDVSGIDFTDFFDQWYFGEGFPIFDLTWSQQADTVKLEVHQSTSTAITPLFRTPMEYKISWAGGDTTIRVFQETNDTVYQLITSKEITEVEIDPKNWILNQGSVAHKYFLDLKVFLQGPFDTISGKMKTDLNPENIPLSQPYNMPPWSYQGTESVSSIPNEIIVDWVLVELRDTTDVEFATGNTMIDRQAVFILKNGEIVGLDGSNATCSVAEPATNNLFVIIWHRNHLGIISASPLSYNKGVYTYDFTSGNDKVYGGASGYSEISPGIWGLVSGDGDANKVVNDIDKNISWEVLAGENGYFSGDYNLDTQVDNKDKDDYWFYNIGKQSQVPE
ncbi:MAG: M1 family metallopeptidase [Chlorobi bacterium]|nr:M1 family metallopeptidase [Chlorobiota bacterium]